MILTVATVLYIYQYKISEKIPILIFESTNTTKLWSLQIILWFQFNQWLIIKIRAI